MEPQVQEKLQVQEDLVVVEQVALIPEQEQQGHLTQEVAVEVVDVLQAEVVVQVQ